MKKMLMLVLILGIASFAGAAVDIYLTNGQGQNEITVAPSSHTTLYVWYTGVSEIDGSGVQMFDVQADVTSGPGTILGGAITATGRATGYDSIIMPSRDELADIELIGGRDDNGALTAGLGNPLATISFHCDDNGDVLIGLADIYTVDQAWAQITPIMHGMTITQIPEPATMALLCLGGLFFRKKK